MYHARGNEHDRRQAEQERRRRIEQRAWLSQIPLDLAEIMSNEVIRLAEDYVRQEFPPDPSLRESRSNPGPSYKELMVVGLKYVTQARSATEQERAAWRAFWARWDAKHAPPAPAELERRRREDERSAALEEQRRDAEMRAARDAFLEE
jgi:hypothetical protein